MKIFPASVMTVAVLITIGRCSSQLLSSGARRTGSMSKRTALLAAKHSLVVIGKDEITEDYGLVI